MSAKTKATVLAAAMAIALPFVAKYEGLQKSAYLDPVGIPTICFGHTEGVVIGQALSKQECDALLALDIDKGFAVLDKYTSQKLTIEQRAAFADFIYNVGEGAFARSTLLKKLNAGDIDGACRELSRWVYADGQRLPGLVKRREAERKLCLSGQPA